MLIFYLCTLIFFQCTLLLYQYTLIFYQYRLIFYQYTRILYQCTLIFYQYTLIFYQYTLIFYQCTLIFYQCTLIFNCSSPDKCVTHPGWVFCIISIALFQLIEYLKICFLNKTEYLSFCADILSPADTSGILQMIARQNMITI